MKSWPRQVVRDAAYLFLPFTLVTFLILLGGTLLVTWGDLSNGVLIGFCVTAGLLVGFFLLCHLVLYCGTWTAEFRADPEGSPTAPTTTTTAASCSESAGRATTGDGPPSAERTSKMVCADCHGRRLQRDASPPQNDARGLNDVNHTPSRFNGVPDEDELFLDLRGQVQGEPRDRSSIRVVHASLQPPPLNVTATRNRNSGLRTVQLAENIGSEQKNSIAQPSLSPSHTRKGFKPGRPPCRVPTVMRPGPAAARTSSQTRWKVPSLKRPGSAMPAAVRDSNVGVIGAAGGAGGAGPVGPTRQIQQEPAPIRLAGRMPLPAPATLSHVLPSPTISSQAQEQGSSTNGDKNGACARKRPVGPRPRPLVSSPYTAEAEHNLFNQEGENTYAVSTQNTTQQSHESMGTQIRNIQQLYQAWPSRLPPSRSKDDKDDTLFTNNQQRGHVVLIQEPDLVYLLSRGILVLKPDSLSNAPAWLLDYGRTGYHDEDEDKDGDQTTGSSADDRLCHKSATRSVRVVEKSSSTASLWASRVRSQMAQIEQINSPKEEDESPMFPKGRGRPQQVRGWPFAASTFADSGEHKMAESRSPLANSELTLSTQQKPKKIDVLSMPSGQDSPPVYGTMSRLSCEGSTEDDAWMLVTPSHGGPGSVSSSRSGSQATTHWSSHVSVSSVTL